MQVKDILTTDIGKKSDEVMHDIMNKSSIFITHKRLKDFYHVDTYETDDHFRLQGYVKIEDVYTLPSDVEIELRFVYDRELHKKILVLFVNRWIIPKIKMLEQ